MSEANTSGVRMVLVCGGRNFNNYPLLYAALDMLDREQRIGTVIHGGAAGADNIAGKWAESRGRACRVEFADWVTNGRKAGPMRNQKMIDDYHPELVVAFPGGRGTEDLVRRAAKAGIEVREIE
jgi:hypothetical protein